MISTYDEERKTHTRSHLDEISREIRNTSLCRPTTSKKIENDFSKIPKKAFGRYNTGLKTKKFLARDRNSPLLTRAKQNKISIDKERLYIENMELKLKNQELNKAIIKFKAKIIQMERDKNKKSEISLVENPSNSNFLVHLLKKTIKDLKIELSNKENEITKFKKTLKYTKIIEMELEVKAYIDECTRLKHHLEEIIEQTETSSKDNFQRDKIQSLMKVIDDNSKEIQRMKDQSKFDRGKGDTSPKVKEEIKKYLKEIEGLKDNLAKYKKEFLDENLKIQKELAEEKGKNANLAFKLKEADRLIENLYLELKMMRQKKPSRFLVPKCLKCLFNLAKSAGVTVEEFIRKQYGNTLVINVTQILYDLQEFDGSVKGEDLDKIIHYVQGSNQNEIHVDRLLKFFNTFNFEESLDFLDTSEKILHLKFRMQLHRIDKAKFIESHFSSEGKNIHMQELVLAISKAPFNFSRQDSQLISNFIFNSKKQATYSEFLQNFEEKVGDWEVFTPKEEENFDSFLMNLVSTHHSNLEKSCIQLDKNEKGFITTDEFRSVLLDSGIKVPERIHKYLLVLFYSHNMEINQVPYKQFFQAYTSNDEKEEETNKEDKTFMYIEEIAQKLLNQGKRVRDVFAFDQNGNIVAEDFIEGLQSMGVKEIPKEDLLELMEGLQNNKEDRIFCINVDDLEDIMENYGVGVQRSELSEDMEVESLAERGEGHVQKVSLLDSIQLDLQEG